MRFSSILLVIIIYIHRGLKINISEIFTSAGVSDPAVATCFIGVISVIFCGFSLWLVEKFGRKPLHMYGIGAIGVCAGVMALLLGIFLGDDNFQNQSAVSTCSIVFVLVFIFVIPINILFKLDICCNLPMWTRTDSMGNGR